VYQQSTGRLICISDNTRETIVDTHGYAGAAFADFGGSTIIGKNMPDTEGIRNVGPLPTGWYTMGQPYRHGKIGANFIPLTPGPGTNTLGRSGFAIHGDRRSGPFGFASKGCIITDKNPREALAESLRIEGGGLLYVYR
jgi:hypothetical protein